MKRGSTFLTIVCAVLLVAFIAGLTGCNTVQGVGKDIESGGKAIQKAAN